MWLSVALQIDAPRTRRRMSLAPAAGSRTSLTVTAPGRSTTTAFIAAPSVDAVPAQIGHLDPVVVLHVVGRDVRLDQAELGHPVDGRPGQDLLGIERGAG